MGKLKTYTYDQSVDSDRWPSVGSIGVAVVTTSAKKAIEIMMALEEIERYATPGWISVRLIISKEVNLDRTPNALYVYKTAKREVNIISWCKPELIKVGEI